MKFTLSWLKEHLKTDASLNDITEALTDLGLEVEGVENPLDKLENFTVGYVSNAEKHPDADKLRVCKVDTDEGELQIICGAPNAREGIYVVVAKPGVYVPGLDITIGVGKIRGIESFGMMASEREMELLVLDATTGQNAIRQVEVFQEVSNVTGLVMTKLDGTAKGGVLVALADKFGLPIHAIGVGEQIDDLQAFDPKDFAKALTGSDV